MSIFDFFKRHQPTPKPTPPPPSIKTRFTGDRRVVRMSDYRQNEQLVGEAQAILMDERFRRMIETVRSSSPAFMSFSGPVDLAQRAIMQARIEGFNQAICCFEALGQLLKPQEPLVETYEAEEPPPEFAEPQQ